MGLWTFYFIAKLYLYFRGFIRLHVLLNLLFLLFLILPSPKGIRSSRSFVFLRSFLNVVLALLLLWRDSWLPPIWDVLGFIQKEGIPSGGYVARFVLGFFNMWEVAALISLFLLCAAAKNRIRLTPVILVFLLIVPIGEIGRPQNGVDRQLDRFYQSESKRVVRFDQTDPVPPDFDILILHVCSLSWDDLKTAGLESDPFLKQFDYVFTHFNSVTTYSNPSAIRLLRANCGQTSHDALYHDASGECYPTEGLRARGYEIAFILNHDGRYSRFAEEAQQWGHLPPPVFPSDLPIQAYNFDGSPIYDDYATVEKGWQMREGKGGPFMIYYNTISLHDGAHRVGDPEWWKRDRTAQYKESVQELFGDFTRIFNRIASSGRNTIVLFVPEHGVALRGSTIQGPGLREIPLPQITAVPVGIKLIGKGIPQAPSRIISAPTSYLSLSYMLAAFLKNDPFRDSFVSPEWIESVPRTDFVSENQGIELVKVDPEYYLRGKDQKWVVAPENATRAH